LIQVNVVALNVHFGSQTSAPCPLLSKGGQTRARLGVRIVPILPSFCHLSPHLHIQRHLSESAFDCQHVALQTLTGGTIPMKYIGIGILFSLLTFTTANAAGWGSIHKYVKRSGNCAGQEILASSYSSGKRTASGERFDSGSNTAAARSWPLGTSLTVTNPKNGRSVTVRINDTGPWGVAYRMGARLDLARGAAQRIGMHGSQYVCVA
jgi:peptidoglycan lytic transglycosylase